MKKLLLFILLVGLSNLTLAQHYIISKEGNRMEGKIKEITLDSLYLEYTFKDQRRKIKIPLEDLEDYGSIKNQSKKFDPNPVPFDRWHVSIAGGNSIRIAKISPLASNPFEVAHLKGLRNGINYDVQIGHFFNEREGLGVQYNLFRCAKETSFWGGHLRDNYALHYIGLNYLMRRELSEVSTLNFSLGSGLSHYNNHAYYQPITMHIKNTSLGFSANGGADFRIAKNLFLGGNLRLISGVARSVNVRYNSNPSTTKLRLNENTYENLSRVDLNIGLRISLD